MPSSRFTVLGNGFNSDLFKPLESPDHTIAERYGLDQEATQKMILFVGKYVEWKGIAWLLQAFANLPQQAACGSTLVVAGTGPQSEKKRYLAMANDLNIERRVRFTGEIAYEDVGSLMNVASVFVLPSYREPFGLALLEALACGCRIVAVDQGGPAVFVPDELKLAKDAILVPGLPESSPTAASAAAFVEHLSAALAEQLDKPSSYDCRCNIARAVQPWSWDTYLDRLLPIYGEIVANGVADDG
jgi:glycosyltransferase involved in cell wall biosynthesis